MVDADSMTRHSFAGYQKVFEDDDIEQSLAAITRSQWRTLSLSSPQAIIPEHTISRDSAPVFGNGSGIGCW